MGTNKIDISTITWPDGDKLISPFVYDENDKLVGFADTKAMIVSGSATTTMNYSHIEADFSSISEGSLTIDAPNATVKKFTWAVSTGGETFDFVIIEFNTTDQETIDTVRTAKRVVNNKLYDVDDNLIGTIDTSKIEVGGIYDEGALKIDGLFSDYVIDLTNMGARRGIVLSEFNSDLSSLRDGSWMFMYCENLTSFSSDLSSLTNGSSMFGNCTNLAEFTIALPSLTNGDQMFAKCSNLVAFTIALPSLTNGHQMFSDCSALTAFTLDLSSLTNGSYMFYVCSNLELFDSDLSSLTNGNYMFSDCSNLTSFTSELPSLTSGNTMFHDCKNLTSFNIGLSSLTNGFQMFWGCENLTSFSSDLSSLTNGSSMFSNCKLDTVSVQNIADTIKNVSSLTNDSSAAFGEIWKEIRIDIGNSTPDEDEIAAFDTIASKGWTVYVNGSEYTPSAAAAIMTLNGNGEEVSTPIPFYAKPIPATEKTASYVDANGNFFNIVGAQFIYGDDLSTYGMFTCEEDAAFNMGLTKIEREN